MSLLRALLDDLAAEGADLDRLVAGLPAEGWACETPAPGWTIAHQISHLAWTDDAAYLAAMDPAAFQALVEQALSNPDGFVDVGAGSGAAVGPELLLDRWRSGRQRLGAALVAVPEGTKLPWYGPPMSAASMATARMMETWAHGQDVADTLGVTRIPTARLKQVAHLGVRTRDFAYLVRQETPPASQFRVELTGPSDEDWVWGPEDAVQRVSGPALDFCLLVTQRGHRDDLAVDTVGADADHWLDIAQAFAGPPGAGRSPRSVEGALP